MAVGTITPIGGVDTTLTYALSVTVANPTAPEFPGAPFAVGTEITTSNGGQYVFVQASTACNASDFVAILASSFAANQLTNTNIATAGVRIGVAPNAAVAAGAFFWAALNGANIVGGARTTAVTNVQLFTSGTTSEAGLLTSVTTSASLAGAIGGIVCIASVTVTTTLPVTATYALSWPRVVLLYSSAVGSISGSAAVASSP